MRIVSEITTLEELERIFLLAHAGNEDIFIELEMEGFEGKELIANPPENILPKLKYYKNTYDENLNHKYAKGIRIVSFGMM